MSDVASVADRLHSASIHLLRRVRKEDEFSGLSPARLSALSVVVFAGPLSPGRLAAAEGVRPPTMTRIIAALEADGFVRRRPDASDRRAVEISATPKGNRLLQRARRRRVELLAGRLSSLPTADVELLSRAADVIEDLFGERR
jgi:DNA-binding MarR family transcriptional regulator